MGIAFRAWAVLMRVVSLSSLWLHVKTCSRCFLCASRTCSVRAACMPWNGNSRWTYWSGMWQLMLELTRFLAVSSDPQP